MSVTNSSFTLGTPQRDGRRGCREVHTLSGGGTWLVDYLAAADFDHSAAMTARVALINAQLADQEVADNLDRDGAPTIAEQTQTEFRTKMREAFRSADKERACQLAWWLLRRIAAGQITDAQARGVFGLTSAQWTTFKTNKLQPRSDAWAAVLAATGE
jgi:hypothetical protein